jgi:hypothetical protein
MRDIDPIQDRMHAAATFGARRVQALSARPGIRRVACASRDHDHTLSQLSSDALYRVNRDTPRPRAAIIVAK